MSGEAQTVAPIEAADAKALEREIDRIVYEFYWLTEDEIAIVEGRKRKFFKCPKEVYLSVCKLVKSRIVKTQSM